MWVQLIVLSSKNQYFVLIFICFYCSVACVTGYISAYELVTLSSFCGRRSHIFSTLNNINHAILQKPPSLKYYLWHGNRTCGYNTCTMYHFTQIMLDTSIFPVYHQTNNMFPIKEQRKMNDIQIKYLMPSFESLG